MQWNSCSWRKGISQDETTLNSENIKPVALSLSRGVQTYTHTRKKQSKASTAVLKQLLLPSEPALGYLYTTQVLEPCAGKSSQGRLVTSRRTNQVTQWKITKPKSSTMTSTLLSETRTVGHLLPQVPIDVAAGSAASPVCTRPPGPYLTAG